MTITLLVGSCEGKNGVLYVLSAACVGQGVGLGGGGTGGTRGHFFFCVFLGFFC